LPSNNGFDDFFDGPSLENMHWLQRPSLENLASGWYPLPTVRSPWELFKDYGYRLEPSFALMFNNSEPMFVSEHLLPIGSTIPKTTSSSSQDLQVLSMSDMLEEAGEAGSVNSMQMFVQGRTVDGDFVHLDMELDEEPLTLDEIVCSIDSDSIIWVTKYLWVKTQIAVNVIPYTGRFPPLKKNNHVYVELLMPQSEEDQYNNGTRTEWFTIRCALSTIPHSHFAKASGS